MRSVPVRKIDQLSSLFLHDQLMAQELTIRSYGFYKGLFAVNLDRGLYDIYAVENRMNVEYRYSLLNARIQ